MQDGAEIGGAVDGRGFNKEELQYHYCQGIGIIDYCIDEADLSLLREMKEDLEECIKDISDKISKIKDDPGDKKYTLKQLRQAWAAGKCSIKETP